MLQPKLLPLVGLLVLCLLVGMLGYAFVQAATRQLLESEARIDAERWSNYLSRNAEDLAAIATGNTPTPQSAELFKRSLAGGHLLSFRIYDANGKLRLQSEGSLDAFLTGQPISLVDGGFAKALRDRKPGTLLLQNNDTGKPRFIASALVPINSEQHLAGWLVVNIDQTSRQQMFASVMTKASIAVSLLLIIGPIFGFWYHSRQKAQLARTIVNLSKLDQLTGLQHKAPFLERVENWLAEGPGDKPQSALIMTELTGSAAIAQAHGQAAEDMLIRHAAERLAEMTDGKAEIASAGRGIFLAFLRAVDDPMDVLSLAKAITTRLGAGFDHEGTRMTCPCHTGIALSSTDGKTAEELMRSAEIATHAAKEQGTPGYGFYNHETASDSRRRTAVTRAITEATAAGAFRLDFQPVYNIRTGELNGFEALIRLHDAELGNVSPAEFIPIAEHLGLINKIGAWCLQEACRVAAQWPPHLMVAVNLSPSQFMSGSLINDVRKALEQSQFPPYRLEVEITEGTLLNDSELVLGQLRVLRDMGVAVALDDFGTGYSSLSYLWRFPFSKLKIDRSFVMALDESAGAKGILRSIVKLGHGLGLTVTAEGIENNAQLSTLRDLGCDLAQGYLLDRPARVADLAAIILRNFANGLTRRVRETAASKPAAQGHLSLSFPRPCG